MLQQFSFENSLYENSSPNNGDSSNSQTIIQ